MPEARTWRAEVRHRFREESFDVAIIGGGITGAGIARDAALRGMRVALLEARDFAAGTSSRSSRLIHGGVRYLEHGHLALVFEASRERRRLLRLAPHLVRPLAFTWPVYRGARISRLKLSAGLGLYDALSAFRNVANHRRLSRDELLRAEPALDPHDLLGGARYFDAATNDSRLTLANVVAAAESGAAVLNHAAATGLDLVGGRARGLHARDAMTAETFVIRTRTVVSAAGPWTDDVRRLEEAGLEPSVRGSRGAHIALPRARLGNRGAVTMLHPADGRVLFALPAGDQAIVGTTEIPTTSGDREPRASREEVQYLLAAANAYFPEAAVTETNVIAAWAGIRPLAATLAGEDVGAASREHTIARGPHGVIHVTGGKLTTYRAMAEQVVDFIAREGGERSRGTALPGGEASLHTTLAEASASIPDEGLGQRLVHAHGTRWREVWSPVTARPSLGERVHPSHPLTAAEIRYAVGREMAMTLGDLLIRRTHAAFELPDQGRALADAVAPVMAGLLHWTSPQHDAALQAYEDEVSRVFGPEG